MTTSTLQVSVPAGGFAPEAAAAAIRAAGLVDQVTRLAAGPFGLTSAGVGLLEAAAAAADLGLAAAATLRGVILDEARTPGSFAVPELGPAQVRLVGAFQAAVMAHDLGQRLAPLGPAPSVEGALELDGLPRLLDAGAAPAVLAERLLTLATRYLARHARAADVAGAASALSAFFELLSRALRLLGDTGALRPLVAALEARGATVAGRPWRGLEARPAGRDPVGLLPVRREQIVGNDEYLEAGLRLARDVAGYDLGRRRNPKRVNPVLFGLGKPGCGKTVTAHAIGHYFLDYCAERGVPARFVVVRRTDWASSYQNASALNLVRLFQEEVYGFEGVAGVYWPDIDTAFASRAASGLRMEEKQNLGAVFGVFDGTLLPRDGKWFLLCDANTLHMDEATVSRIAQNPFTVTGPTTPAHYVRLMRGVLLADVADLVEADDADWDRIGRRAAELAVPGRGIDAVCGNVRALIQDFEYPDEYFAARGPEREAMLRALYRSIGPDEVLERLEHWVAFQRDAEERATAERFEREVDEVVRHLNAGRAAAERVAGIAGIAGIAGTGEASAQ